MTITRTKHYVSDDPVDQKIEELAYCKKCLATPGRRLSKLGERVYPTLGPNDPFPSDHEKWRQCPTCGNLVAIINVKKEGKLVPRVGSVPDNPLDGLESSVESTHRSTKPNKYDPKSQEKRLKLEEINSIKDTDAKRLMLDGRKLISYNDTMENR